MGFFYLLLRRGARQEEKEKGDTHEHETTDSVIVLAAGPCDTGRTANKDAGSGPASQSSSQTTGLSTDAKQHPPTESMNRASGDVAASSQDTQRQMQGQPTAAQQAEGAKPGSPMNSQEAVHAQPSVAEQPKGEGQTADKGC